MTRLNDLCASGCVKQIDGRYVLTSEGQKIAATLDFMQLVLGRKGRVGQMSMDVLTAGVGFFFIRFFSIDPFDHFSLGAS